MSKPLTFLRKLKLFRLYLKEQQNGVIVDCAICGSTNINFEKQSASGVITPQLNPKRITHSTLYNSIYTCNECGAECLNRQEWFNA